MQPHVSVSWMRLRLCDNHCACGCSLELRGSDLACACGCARGCVRGPHPVAARARVPVAARLLPLSCVPRLAAPVVACACVRACGSCTRRFGYSQDTITNCRDVPPLRPGRSLGCPRLGGAGGPGPGLRLHAGLGVPVQRLQRPFVLVSVQLRFLLDVQQRRLGRRMCKYHIHKYHNAN